MDWAVAALYGIGLFRRAAPRPARIAAGLTLGADGVLLMRDIRGAAAAMGARLALMLIWLETPFGGSLSDGAGR